ncbi:MAG: hypothetical protein HUU43_13540 [Ignavibacteriaceae bacterium]|nr:hypothetical protein [Ignavibacteriaceae bacterium]
MNSLIFRLIIFILFTGAMSPQTLNLSVSGKADSLSALFLKTQPKFSEIRTLAEEYLKKGYYELALIELSDKNKYLKYPDHEVEELYGDCLFFLNKAADSRKALTGAYILNPSEKILLKLALLEFIAGDSSAAEKLTERIKKRNSQYFTDIKELLTRFDDGNSLIPQSTLRMLKRNDPESYSKYFIRPEITIRNPADGYYTKDSIISVLLGITHNKPVKTLLFNGRELFRRDNDRYGKEDENYAAEFSERFTLSPGINTCEVIATDIFGLDNRMSVNVFCDRFPIKMNFSAAIVDSVKNLFSYTGSFVNLNEIRTDSVKFFNLFIYDSKADVGNIPFFSELTTHNTFKSPEETALSNRYISELIATDATLNYLLSSPEIISHERIVNVFLKGRWNKTTDDYQLILYDRILSVKSFLSSLSKLQNPGVNLIFDGYSEDRQGFIEFARLILESEEVPFNLIFTDQGFSEKFFTTLKSPVTGDDSLFTAFIYPSVPDSNNPGMHIEKLKHDSEIPLFINIFGSVRLLHLDKFNALKQKLPQKKLFPQQEKKIIDFLTNWKMYNELVRFSDDLITLSDLNARIDEYNNRLKEGKK